MGVAEMLRGRLIPVCRRTCCGWRCFRIAECAHSAGLSSEGAGAHNVCNPGAPRTSRTLAWVASSGGSGGFKERTPCDAVLAHVSHECG